MNKLFAFLKEHIYIILVAIITILLLIFLKDRVGQRNLVISHFSGMYDETITVTISSPHIKAGDIYYTLDGTDPVIGEENTILYENPIVLEAGEEEKVYSFRFKEYRKHMDSKINTRTYIVGKHIKDRYDEESIIVSIVTDPDNLYGYENGIFVEGKIYDDYKKEHPEEADIVSSTPTNFNQTGIASERTVYAEMFTSDGKLVISQQCGIRTGGQFSRISEQKPFRLFAREEYGCNTFAYPFFVSDDEKEGMGLLEGNYSTLFFRNSGDDRQEAFARDAVGHILAREAGFPDTEYVRPACVYINGNYAGFYWLQSQYNNSYFKAKYGKYSGSFVTIGSGDKEKETDTENPLSNQYAQEYMDIYQKFASLDLNQEENYQELCQVIDVENYLQYFAIQIYLGNDDWPHNNNKCYRFVSSAEVYSKNSVFDGRYRYLLYDLDATMGNRTIRDSAQPQKSAEKLQELLDGDDAPLFKAIMERKDCQLFFRDYMYDMMDQVFTTENVSRVVDEINEERIKEIYIYLEEITGYTKEEYKYLDMQLDAIKAWSEETPLYMKAKIYELWGI